MALYRVTMLVKRKYKSDVALVYYVVAESETEALRLVESEAPGAYFKAYKRSADKLGGAVAYSRMDET